MFKTITMNKKVESKLKKNVKETIEAIEEANEIIKNPGNYKTYKSVYEMIDEIENESK